MGWTNFLWTLEEAYTLTNGVGPLNFIMSISKKNRVDVLVSPTHNNVFSSA